jgi:uncharacterized protein
MLMAVSSVRLLAPLLLTAAAWAYDFTALKPQGYVSDFAGVVDAQSKAALESWCGRVKESTGAEIALVTSPTLHGEPVEDVANALFRAWGIGQKGENNGILLLLVTQDRRSRLEVGYGLEPLLPDGFSGSLLREMRPALRESHYGDALILAARAIGLRIAEAKGVSISEAPRPRRSRPREGFPWHSIIPLVIFAFFLWSVGPRSGFRRSSPFFLPFPLTMSGGRRSGGWGSSHGGFGGYDSGGGFSGFGGGDSGGGGASSDW